MCFGQSSIQDKDYRRLQRSKDRDHLFVQHSQVAQDSSDSQEDEPKVHMDRKVDI